MCRLIDHSFTGRIVIALAIACFSCASARADDVADYLEQHGLKSLLAVHLEQQIEQASGAEAADLVLRLASVYTQLLETVSDPAARQELEQRSKRLLDKAPANAADELRLALLRGSYRVAERIAENHRLRLATEEEIASATQTLTEMLPQLESLRQRLKREVEVMDRRQSRAAGTLAAALSEAGEKARNLYSQCTFLNAWALYYQSWLHRRNTEARVAEPLFSELLLTESPYPQPQDVSVDLRSNESIARAILGMALCKSLTETSATAIAWIQLLEEEGSYEPLRVQAAVWRMVIYLEHGEYQQVSELLAGFESRRDIPLPWLRLLAVHGLENSQRSRLADELSKIAVLELAARGELQQVLDLATRYGAEALGREGFALKYVHGVIQYKKARDAHGSETPVLDQSIASLYVSAETQLKAALAEQDASKYPSAAASCRILVAWSLYFRGQFLDARAAFEQAFEHSSGDEAAEALWMAIVSFDKLLSANPQPELQAQLDQMMDRFIQQFPSHERTPLLQLRRAAAATKPTDQAADELLAIPEHSPVYDAARRQAAEVLYQLFRAAKPEERFYRATRFLAVAVPLLSDGVRESEIADAAGMDAFIVRCRQVLEIALSEGIDDVRSASAALAVLEDLRSQGVDLSSIGSEIDCRRVQEKLARGDINGAGELANALWAQDQSSNWSRIATRAVFRRAYQMWKGNDPASQQQGCEMVIRFGGRVLHEFRNVADPLSQPGALAYHIAVAEASLQMWEQTGDQERARAAMFLYEKLLAHQPRNAQFLRAVALLSDRLGDSAKALDCWRTLLAGTQQDSPAWYEAKYYQVEILSRTDPALAREVMDQHKMLFPNFGPEPWGSKLQALDANLLKK